MPLRRLGVLGGRGIGFRPGPEIAPHLVVARSAEYTIGAFVTVDEIMAGTAGDSIGAAIAEDDIIVSAAADSVVALATVHGVAARTARHPIVPVRRIQTFRRG